MEKISLSEDSYIIITGKFPMKGQINVRGYCRCSTDKQVKENGSIEVQIENIKRYCEQKDFCLSDIYVDEAITGTKGRNDRLALDNLWKDVKRGEIIVCSDTSRLGRNLADTFTFTDDMKKKKVGVHVCGIGDISQAHGASFKIMSVMASIEQSVISERVSTAMQSLKAKGELKTRPKFGERWTGIKRTYETDTEAMKIIEYLRELRLTEPEISYREMAKRLNETFDPAMFKKTTWRGPDIKRYSLAHSIPLKDET